MTFRKLVIRAEPHPRLRFRGPAAMGGCNSFPLDVKNQVLIARVRADLATHHHKARGAYFKCVRPVDQLYLGTGLAELWRLEARAKGRQFRSASRDACDQITRFRSPDVGTPSRRISASTRPVAKTRARPDKARYRRVAIPPLYE
jgi:hypothetical protein